jgi:hypothetical protein
MLIKSYGLFWREQEVFWGKPNVRGTLEGYWAGAKKAGVVDFREQRGVYILYDVNYKMLYVGQAGKGNHSLFSRLKNHRMDRLADRWSMFSWFGTRGVSDENTLLDDDDFDTDLGKVLSHIEGILIAAAEPPLNLQSGSFGNEVYKFIQVKKS